MSSNPFRKKALQAIDTGRAQSPAKSSLRSSSSNSPLPAAAAALEGSDAALDSDVLRRPKPVKKVRVMSPPPLSPDSPEWPRSSSAPFYEYPPPGAVLGPDAAPAFAYAPGPGDPFNGAPASADDESDRETASSTATPPPPPRPPAAAVKGRNPGTLVAAPMPISTPTSSLESAAAAAAAGVPANPFSKTLQDLEQSRELEAQNRSEGEALKAGNAAARQSLNVDSFRRLLMTGKADDDDAARKQDDLTGSINRPTARDEDDTSESTDYITTEDEAGRAQSSSPNQQKSSKEKKAPPPPPSSRHGKSLKEDASARLAPSTTTSTDINKPLPISPVRRSYDDESPFDRESAGKVPESEEEPEEKLAEESESTTQSLATTPARQPSLRKSAPAPPPRRGHARSDTRSESQLPQPQHDAPARTSTDDGTPRQPAQAPLPPPPRRPHATPRQTSSQGGSAAQIVQAAASTPSLSHYYESDSDRAAAASDATPAGSSPSASKLPSPRPPAPPPARNSSVRQRPPSVSSVDGISRRISGEAPPRTSRDGAPPHLGPPPPPPPKRQRGNSSSSTNDLRRASGESASRPQLQHPSGESSGKGVDILADLDALQREVDALRGKMR
ncbi:hypothetical protein JDV02_004113 [Purpureocillium takamizusanense]|uniref:Uncharacterized protein n=1 Tax=Purpureocillium takamizusanense TaxID=2060973 RepID=A0A9Q8VAE8_9HYPO|nr:uncharacterized protein JDV02_004113 [Purpureocillium takamizusanense]UNI17794.1 hypothetical protein JDV02_004113 [Purpureocillium takamizusanense]